MNRLLVILLAASFALTAVAAVTDHALGGGARPAEAQGSGARPMPATQTRVPGIGVHLDGNVRAGR